MTRTLDFFRSVPSRLQQRGLQGLAADQGEIDAEEQRRKEEEERARQLEQIRKQFEDAHAQTTQAAQQTTFRDDLLSQAKSRFEELTGHLGQAAQGAAQEAGSTFGAIGEARDQAMQTPTRDVADTLTGTVGETVGGAASGAGAAVSGAIGQYGDWRDDLQTKARGPQTSALEGQQAQAIGGAVRSAAQAVVPGLADLEAQGHAQRQTDLEAGKTNVPAEPVSGAEAALMGARRREGWDESQNAERDRQRRYREASERQDTAAMAAIQAEERQATQAEGGLLPAIGKRLGRAVGQGVLGALGSDPNAPGSTYAPKEERAKLDAQGRFTGENETVEAPQGLARIRRDVPEQVATLTGRGKRNENPLERAQAGFGLAMTPFNVTGELAAGAAGEISDDEVIAAEARLAGDVLGPGGPVREFGAAGRAGVDALKAARAGGTLEDVLTAAGGLREAGKAAMTGSAIAISPGAGMQAYREGRAKGLSHEEALAQAIEMAGNVAQAGEIGDLAVGLGKGAVKGVTALPNAPRALLGATGNITPDMSLGEGLRGAAGTAARELGAYGRGVTEDLTGALAREGQRPATALGAKVGREQLLGDATPDSPEVARLRQQVGEINQERAQAAQALGKAGIKLGPPDRPPRGLTPEQQPTWDAYANASRQATNLQNEITRLKQGAVRGAETALAEPTGVAPPGLPRQGRGSYEATPPSVDRYGRPRPPTMTDVTQTKQGEAPAFYSALQQAVTQLPEGKLSPAQLGKQLLAMPEVKRDQIVWSGLDDYLGAKLQANGGRGEAVTKGELSTWLQDHDVRVYEIAKGSSADPAMRRQVVETHAQAQERYQTVQDTYRDSHAQRIEDARQLLTAAQDRVRADQGRTLADSEDTYVHADALIGGYPNVPPGESVFEAIAQDPRGGPGSLSPLLQALTPEERASLDALRRADATEGAAVQDAYRAEADARMAVENAQEATALPGGPAEWAKAGYVMPEGWAPEANAREFLLTLGPRSDMPDWQKPAHWQEPNVIAHLRVSDRMTPDGRRVLFVEELQSDWHQDARDVVKNQSGQDITDPATGRAQRVGYYEGQRTPAEIRGSPEWGEYQGLEARRQEAGAAWSAFEESGQLEAAQQALGAERDPSLARVMDQFRQAGIPDQYLPELDAQGFWRRPYETTRATTADTPGLKTRRPEPSVLVRGRPSDRGDGGLADVEILDWTISRQMEDVDVLNEQARTLNAESGFIAPQGYRSDAGEAGDAPEARVMKLDTLATMLQRQDPAYAAARAEVQRLEQESVRLSEAYDDALNTSQMAAERSPDFRVGDMDQRLEEIRQQIADLEQHPDNQSYVTKQEREQRLIAYLGDYKRAHPEVDEVDLFRQPEVQAEFARLSEGLDEEPPRTPEGDVDRAQWDAWSERQDNRERLKGLRQEARSLEREITARQQQHDTGGRPPAGPFKGEGWQRLALKRLLHLAATEDYDALGLTPGDVHAQRYNPFRQGISALTYDLETQALRIETANRRTGMPNDRAEYVKPDDLHRYVGREVAQRLLDPEAQAASREARAAYDAGEIGQAHQRLQRLRGAGAPPREVGPPIGVRIGQEDMAGLTVENEAGAGLRRAYDEILPAMLNDLARRFGARVQVAPETDPVRAMATGQTEAGVLLDPSKPPDALITDQPEVGQARQRPNFQPAHLMDVTPEMKAALTTGNDGTTPGAFPLFIRPPQQARGDEPEEWRQGELPLRSGQEPGAVAQAGAGVGPISRRVAEEAAAPGPVSRTGTTPQPTLETTPGAGDAPFYSALSRAIESPKLPETMKPAWLAGQLKGLGVTTDELRWTGLDDYLAQKITSGERVTKQEIRDYLVDNKVEVVEVALGADPARLQDWAAAAQDLKTLRKQLGRSGPRTRAGGVEVLPEGPPPDRMALMEAEERVQQAEQAVFTETRQGRRDEAPDAPRWPDYSSAGKSYYGGEAGYREFVLLLPQDSRAGRQMANAGGEPYTHGHWGDLPNPLLHVRTTVRTLPDGRRVLYVEEVQSDLHQAARNPIRNEATGEKLLDPVTGKPQQVGYRATRTPFTADDPRLAARRPLHEAAAEARAEFRRIDDLKQNSDPADPEYREILDARDAALDRMRETEAALTGRQPDGSKIEPTLDELEADVVIQRERSDAATARAQQLLDAQTANRPEGQSASSAAVGQAQGPAWALERERGTDPASQLRAARNEASLERRALDTLEQKVAAHPEGKGPPEAPFGETSQWASLALKRMLRVAADEGLDGVAITSGENAARRVNAAQQVQEITWEPYSGQTKIVDTNGETHRLRFTEARLREHVGDEMAQRLIDKAEADNDRYEQEMTQAETEQMDAARDSYRDEFFQENPDATEEDFENAIERGALDDYQADFEHLDPVQGSLSQEEIGEASMVGNTKMMGWYDQDVVNIAAKLGKKFGATVERNVALEAPGSELGTVPTNLPGQEDTHGVSPTEPVTVIGLPESARQQIREQGLPLFLQRQRQAQQDGAAGANGAPGRGLERVAEAGGAVAGGVRGWQSAEEESERRVAEGEAGLTGVEKAASALGMAAGGATAGRLGVRGARLAKVAGQPGAARGSALLDFLRGGPGADLLGVGQAPREGRSGRSGVTAFGQEEAGGQPMAPTPGERFRDRQGIAQPHLGLEPHTPEGQVVDALDAKAEQSGVSLDDVLAGEPGAIEAYYPTIEELATLPGAPPAKNKFGTARPIKDLLTFMEAGLNRGAHRWYNELSDLLREYSTPLQQALGDPSERPDLWQELVGLYGRTGQRTTPEANLEISLAAILARDDLRRKGIDVTALDPKSEHDQGVLRHAMRPYTQIVTGKTKGQIEPAAIQAEVDRRKAALATLYPTGTVPPVTTLKELDRADGGDRVRRDEAAKVGGVPTTGLVLGDILAMWKTGQADIDGNLKLATYFSVIKDQATGQVSLGSVPDIWMFKAFGHENIEAMSANSEASRYILGVIARLAGERGITPDQAQAAIWVGVRELFDTDPRWRGEHALREDAAQRPGALKGATEDAAKAEAKVISRLPLAETLGARATEAREALEAAKARGVPVPGAPSKQQRANPEMAEAVGFYDQEMTARRAARKAQADADAAEASASMALGERERIAGGGPIQHKPPTAIAGIRTRLEANGYGDEVGDLTDPATLSRFMATTGTPESMQKVNEGLIDLFRRRVAQPDGISPAPLGGELSVAHSTKPPALPYTQSEATSVRGRQRALEQGRTVRFAPPFHPGAGRLQSAGVTPPAGWGTTPAKARADTVTYLKAVWGYDERTSTLRALTPYARHRVTLDLLGTWADDAGAPIEEYNVGIHLPLATQTQAEQVASMVGAVTLQDAMGIARPKANVPAPGTPERRTAQKTPSSGVDNQVVLTHPENKAWTRPEIVTVFGSVVPGMEITPGGKLVINNYEGVPAMAFAWDVRKRLRAAKPNLNVTKLVSYTSVDFTYIPSNDYGQHIRAGGDTALRAPGQQASGAGSSGAAGAVGQLGADQAGGHDRGGDGRNGPVDGRGPNTRGPATLGSGFFDDLRGKTRRHLEQQGWTFPEGWTERDTAALFPAPGGTNGSAPGASPGSTGIVPGRGAAHGQPAFTALEQAPEDVRGLARRLQQTYQETAGGFGLPVDRLDAAAAAAGAAAGGVAETQLEAPEDETPQERLQRIAGGAATGGVAGVTARRGGASILRNLPAFHADEVGGAGQLGRSGISARAAQQALEQAVSNGASEAEIARMAREVVAAKAAAAAPPPPAPGPPGAARKAWGGLKDLNTGANSLVRASALSSPLTLGRNVVQGAAGAVEQPLERFIAAGLDDVIGKVRQDRGTRAGEQVSVQEAGAMAKASLTGLGQAFTAGKDAFWGRGAQGDLGATQGVSRMETRLGKAVEQKTDALFAPTKFINGFFNALSEHVETAGLTTREARATGQDVAALRANPSLTTQARATRAAEYRSLQDQMDGLGKALSVVGEVPIVGPALMPFYKTPYNAVKYGLERMPGTSLLYTAKKWADPNASNAEVAEQAARAVYGLALWTGFFALATASDRLTGAEPSNQTEREEWQAEGKQPYSVRIGDRWFSFSLFPAIHNALVTAAETGDLVRQATRPEERDSEDVAGAVFTKLLMIGKEAAQRPVFGGLTDLLDAMDEPEKNGPRLGESIVGNFSSGFTAPAIGRWVANALDPYERTAKGLGDRVQAAHPWDRQALPIARTHMGDDRNRVQGLEGVVGRALFPLKTSRARPDRQFYEYGGAQSAKQDRMIRQAKTKVDRYNRAKDEYPVPTHAEFDLAEMAKERDPDFDTYRAEEAKGRRLEQTARGGGGTPQGVPQRRVTGPAALLLGRR